MTYIENAHVKTLGRRKENWLLPQFPIGEADDIIALT